MNQGERDLLIRIDENMTHVKDWSAKHEEKDDLRYLEIKKQVGWMQKIIFMALGIVAFVKFFIK